MQFTKAQMRTLRYYYDHRERLPTAAGFLRRFYATLILWSGTAVVASLVCVKLGFPEFAYLSVGILLGAALREIRQHIWTVRVWPAILAIIDCQELEKLVREAETRA